MKMVALLCTGMLTVFASASVEAAPSTLSVDPATEVKVETSVVTPAPETKSEPPTPAPAPTAEQCLERVKSMESMMPNLMASATAAIHELLKDPVAYEKTLPPMEKVVADKDATNLKNYGGLAEAYFYAGDKVKGEALYAQFKSNSKQIFGPTETFQALVEGDMGLVYFYENNFEKAEPLLLDSMNQLKANLTAAVANNLITDYMCLTLINNKRGNTDDAKKYAKELVDLAIKTRTKAL